jgi:hypothetical protein
LGEMPPSHGFSTCARFGDPPQQRFLAKHCLLTSTVLLLSIPSLQGCLHDNTVLEFLSASTNLDEKRRRPCDRSGDDTRDSRGPCATPIVHVQPQEGLVVMFINSTRPMGMILYSFTLHSSICLSGEPNNLLDSTPSQSLIISYSSSQTTICPS